MKSGGSGCERPCSAVAELNGRKASWCQLPLLASGNVGTQLTKAADFRLSSSADQGQPSAKSAN